jgi:hypothetical protein
MESVTLWLPASLDDELAKMAAERFLTKNQFIEEMLAQHLAAQKPISEESDAEDKS